jgi:hypothetical protein
LLRGDGDTAAMPGPSRGIDEDARGRVASPTSGRERRRREVQRGGAVDRGSARTALGRTRGRPGPRFRSGSSGGSRDGCGKAEAGGSPSSEAPPGRLIWQADGRLPSLVAARLRPRVSQRSPRTSQDGRDTTSHRKVTRGRGCNREPSSPQGARDGSRLQKSVRRIFLVAQGVRREAAPEHEVARGDQPALDGAGPGSKRATGCGAQQCT